MPPPKIRTFAAGKDGFSAALSNFDKQSVLLHNSGMKIQIGKWRMFAASFLLALAAGLSHGSVFAQDTTLLHAAAAINDVDTIALALDDGADIEERDGEGWTAMHHAAYNNSTDAISALIERGAAVNSRDYIGRAPIHIAALQNTPEAIFTLAKGGADIHAQITIALSMDEARQSGVFHAGHMEIYGATYEEELNSSPLLSPAASGGDGELCGRRIRPC